MKLLKLDLDIDSIIIGERVKGGIYRPCLETIPSSTVQGAFKYALGIDVRGVGFFEAGTYEIRDFTYSVKDKFFEIAKMPFTSSCLYPSGRENIKAVIYLIQNGSTDKNNFQNLTLTIGALKSKGFGKARVVNVEEIESEIKQGLLNARVLASEASLFGITVLSPIYGYLFYVENPFSGIYKRALFEESLVTAPEVFLKEATFYDE
ncbi:MAG: hypothetical protein KG029_08190 [Bacteroidetes bacterium]|nr:hypothetical protein [Bacteroidota bacterium]